MDPPNDWYNLLADLDFELPPDLPPPNGAAGGLSPQIPLSLIRQELSTKRWIAIPDDVGAPAVPEDDHGDARRRGRPEPERGDRDRPSLPRGGPVVRNAFDRARRGDGGDPRRGHALLRRQRGDVLDAAPDGRRPRGH